MDIFLLAITFWICAIVCINKLQYICKQELTFQQYRWILFYSFEHPRSVVASATHNILAGGLRSECSAPLCYQSCYILARHGCWDGEGIPFMTYLCPTLCHAYGGPLGWWSCPLRPVSTGFVTFHYPLSCCIWCWLSWCYIGCWLMILSTVPCQHWTWWAHVWSFTWSRPGDQYQGGDAARWLTAMCSHEWLSQWFCSFSWNLSQIYLNMYSFEDPSMIFVHLKLKFNQLMSFERHMFWWDQYISYVGHSLDRNE